MAPRNCETSLPSISPKPPGSRKSRCMSMISSAQCFGRERELVRFGGEVDGRGHLRRPVARPPGRRAVKKDARTVPAGPWTLARHEGAWIAYGLDSGADILCGCIRTGRRPEDADFPSNQVVVSKSSSGPRVGRPRAPRVETNQVDRFPQGRTLGPRHFSRSMSPGFEPKSTDLLKWKISKGVEARCFGHDMILPLRALDDSLS